MREIKLRVWDVSDERMYYNVTNISDVNGYIMQFTGLYDKNNREIYEGDIVKTDLGNGVVVFDSGAFLVRNLDDDEYYGFDDFFSSYEGGCYLVEIIGNIYENKHLLGEVNNERRTN